jgi:hypothetical protein
MRRSALLAALALVAIATCGCSIIRAQPTPTSSTGTLQGIITGPSGPIPDAAVTIFASDATQHVGVSDSGGFYSIAGVPVGQASYSVRAAGFAESDGSVVIAADPQTNRQDVSLNPQ